MTARTPVDKPNSFPRVLCTNNTVLCGAYVCMTSVWYYVLNYFYRLPQNAIRYIADAMSSKIVADRLRMSHVC